MPTTTTCIQHCTRNSNKRKKVYKRKNCCKTHGCGQQHGDSWGWGYKRTKW